MTTNDDTGTIIRRLRDIKPLLCSVPMSAIRSALGVSKWYASKIRQGYRPHSRHWQALAELVHEFE